MKKIFTLLLALLLVYGALNTAVLRAGAVRTLHDEPAAEEPEEEQVESQRLEAALAWAVETAEDNSHGYSQGYRYGPNYDCASFVTAALIAGGFDLDKGLTTYTMKNALEEAGFTAYRRGETEPRKGDILLNPVRHAEICMGGTECVAAHQDYGWRAGDSTGKEIEYRKGTCWFCIYGHYSWILRFEGPDPVVMGRHIAADWEIK